MNGSRYFFQLTSSAYTGQSIVLPFDFGAIRHKAALSPGAVAVVGSVAGIVAFRHLYCTDDLDLLHFAGADSEIFCLLLYLCHCHWFCQYSSHCFLLISHNYCFRPHNSFFNALTGKLSPLYISVFLSCFITERGTKKHLSLPAWLLHCYAHIFRTKVLQSTSGGSDRVK